MEQTQTQKTKERKEIFLLETTNTNTFFVNGVVYQRPAYFAQEDGKVSVYFPSGFTNGWEHGFRLEDMDTVVFSQNNAAKEEGEKATAFMLSLPAKKGKMVWNGSACIPQEEEENPLLLG